VGKSALLVCPEAPFPAIGGGALRTASLATYLGSHYELDLIIFREPGSAVPAAPPGLARHLLIVDLPRNRKDPVTKSLRNLHRLLRFIPPHEDRFRGHEATINKWLDDRHYDLICLEHFWTSTYFDLFRPKTNRLLCDLHNIESVFYESRAGLDSPPLSWIWRRFAAANRVRERQRLPGFDTLLMTSPEDAARVNLPNTVVYPNAIPFVPMPRVAKEMAIAFSGNLEFPPNIAAVEWFASQVWPALAEEFPDLEWRIIGKGESFVRAITKRLVRVSLTGPVNDAVRELAKAQVAVVPIRSGSGTRLKILEAWAAGTAVVSTALGAEGLHAEGAYVHAESNVVFINAIRDLLTNNSERDRVAIAGRRVYEQRFTWPVAWRSLESNGI